MIVEASGRVRERKQFPVPELTNVAAVFHDSLPDFDCTKLISLYPPFTAIIRPPGTLVPEGLLF